MNEEADDEKESFEKRHKPGDFNQDTEAPF
jgi:hypothetical protein